MLKHKNRLLKKFVGVNTEYYSKVFESLEKTNYQYYFNWAALFLGSFWFFYRRIYFVGILLIVSPFLLFFIYVFLFKDILPSELFLILAFAVRFGCAYFSNTLYWHKWLNYEAEYWGEKTSPNIGINFVLPIALFIILILFFYWLLSGMMKGMQHT